MQFEFDFGKKGLSTQYILSKINQESIFRYYTNKPVDKKLHCSCIREDKHPTCGYWKNSKTGKLYLKDFATGDNYDCWAYIQAMFGCSFKEALEIVAKDFGISNNTINKSRIIREHPFKGDGPTIIQIEVKPFSSNELEWWNSYGITPKLLSKYRVFSAKHVFLNGRIILTSSTKQPIYAYYGGKKDNIEQWRIYRPQAESHSSKWISNYRSDYIQGYKQLPSKGNLLVITKSLKDCIALRAYKIPACAPCSENLFIKDNILDDLKSRFKHIIVIFDNDKTGLTNMWKIRKQYPELKYFFIPKSFKAKDFTDFRRKYGDKDTKKYISLVLKEFNLCQ